jgi:hypothetical protein
LKIIFFNRLPLLLCLLFSTCSKDDNPARDYVRLKPWDRGIKVESMADTTKFAYFWFYEWHLFDAIEKGEHTRGKWDWSWRVDTDGQSALLDAGWLKLRMEAMAFGSNMQLEITNISAHDWPEIAAIIPCFNPGTDRGKVTDAVANPAFFDDTCEHTWFFGDQGLDLIKGKEFPREIHFNQTMLPALKTWRKEQNDGTFVFADKWPTSERAARAGLIIRESEDHQWVMGIAWDDFVSVQGHNPWKCMHLSIKVGPLKIGEKKTLTGKLYLFKGSKEDCLQKYQQNF